MTIAEALEIGSLRLREAGIVAADQDAERLLRHALGWSRARLIGESSSAVSTETEADFRHLVAERARRRPLQHLTGKQWFWHHEFLVGPDVLIPRPETEQLVEAALERLRSRKAPVIVDVGTGSGCIALSLATERPDARVVATDISPAALRMARANADRLGLAQRVRFLEGDLLAPVSDLAGQIDLLACNPPYVDSLDAENLAPEVSQHEPAVALYPPGEPYGVYRRLIPQAAASLRPGGFLLLEVGQGMAEEVERICREAGLLVEDTLADLQGIPRTVVASAPRERPTTPGETAVD